MVYKVLHPQELGLFCDEVYPKKYDYTFRVEVSYRYKYLCIHSKTCSKTVLTCCNNAPRLRVGWCPPR